MRYLLACLLVVPLAAACSAGKLAADDLEAQLETNGLGGQSVFDARCRDAIAGWHYVCTFRLGRKVSREKAAFVVGRESVERSTGVLALDLPLGPGPGEPERAAWTAFVKSANAICDQRRLEISSLPRGRGGRGSFRARFAAAARIQSEERARLAALRPPLGAESARQFRNLLEGQRRMVEASARFLAAARRGKVDAARAAAGEVEVAARRLDKLARSLGLIRCQQTR